jgi:hypothetical protein
MADLQNAGLIPAECSCITGQLMVFSTKPLCDALDAIQEAIPRLVESGDSSFVLYDSAYRVNI